ncbi:hypothetical protein KUV99_00640 [Vibrio harveyi]|uniref:hypothetical protein n=1 Tax=Vibrio harveyi TaxID=669 RepID=UPI001C94902A|nr:hypothetical protein [Vibrio harveyi]MBY6234658.1 hypothetical protein [Vibrio harveyi]
MRTVEKYQSVTEHLFNDHRIQKYGMMLVRHGVKGAAKKINPVAMYVDAGLSVLDACNSYLRYAKEREITKQILAENRRLEAEFSYQLKIMKEQHKTMIEEGEARFKFIEQLIQQDKLKIKNAMTELNKMLSIAKSMQNILRAERENGVNFEQLNKLQMELDRFIRVCLVIIMNTIEE